ncbi:integrase [Bradyrhizobium sp. USDA 377]
MIVEVRLRHLNIVHGRKPNTWYVYPRGGGPALIKGFVGTRDELMRRLEQPDLINAYNRPRLLKRRAGDFPMETLGGFIHWFSCGAIDDEEVDGYPKWKKLADATRKDYLEGFDYLRPEFDVVLKDITQPDLYAVRDACANAKWPRFADQMIAALSSMFRQAVKRGKMPFNPCLGMDKIHEPDPDSNREWLPPEWKFAAENAPLEVLIPMMTARYIGLRGQTIVRLNRNQFEDHPLTGKAVRYTARKNKNAVRLPVMQEYQDFLTSLTVQRADGLIAVRNDGSEWKSEKEMQTKVSHWLRGQEAKGLIGTGTTLHGLRVSYAAWWKRNGASDSEIAALIGDKSLRMGAHYTRHVESEVSIVRAFNRIKR